MRYLKTFGNHNNYEDFTETEAFVKPNVSYCIQQNEVHYNPLILPLVIKYNVADASNPTQLYFYYAEEGEEDYWQRGVDMFTNVKIDGVDVSVETLDTAEGKYQLSVGEHTIKYTLKDPTSIADYVFSDCNSLISVTIPNSVSSIGESAFSGCSDLISLIISNSVSSIGGSAFYGCTSLTSVTIGNSVTSIGDFTFNRCTSLTSVTIPNSVTSIGYSAFGECSSLTSITIPNSVTTIGTDAISFCNNLTSIIVETGNTTYDSRNDCNAIIETASNTLVAGCKNTVIPNSVTSIGENAFGGCSGLTSVIIPNSVISIGSGAFSDCNGLTSIIISNSVTNIGSYAFANCSNLNSVTIGNSVINIETYAFHHCSNLTTIISLAIAAPTIKNDTFQDVKTNGTLTVPSGSSGYNVWMGTGNYYLGKYGWTKVEQ